MNFLDACKEMVGAFEMRYWMVYSLLVMIASAFGLLNIGGIVFAFVAVALGGFLSGMRQNRESRK
jgi:ABC-type multidrug transport system permease subunit